MAVTASPKETASAEARMVSVLVTEAVDEAGPTADKACGAVMDSATAVMDVLAAKAVRVVEAGPEAAPASAIRPSNANR